jgi:DNA replication protein DnaC
MDYSKILSQLTPAKPKRISLATEEIVTAEAKRMASLGYHFSETTIKALEAYLNGYSLGLIGNVGTGKTMFFRLLKPYRVDGFTTPEKITIVSISQLSVLTTDYIRSYMTTLKDCEIVIDDVGAEKDMNNYGVKLDLLQWILDFRIDSKHRTHFTSNIANKDLIARYGARTTDRLKLRKVFELQGKSYRTPKQNAFLVAAHNRKILIPHTITTKQEQH